MTNRPAMVVSPRMRRLWPIVVACVLAAGCSRGGPALAPVTGVATLDGKPVAGAAVSFMPVGAGRPASGITDVAGRFKLTTFDDHPGDGAMIGEHSIAVTKIEPGSYDVPRRPDGLPVPGGQPKARWLTPERYANPATSGLRGSVHAGANEIPLKLTVKH